MTNGEKLKEVFPSIELYEKSHDAIQINFDSVWWNAEYKEPTTKNNLGVDCIDKTELLKAMDTWDKFGYTARYGLERLDKDDKGFVPYVKYDDMVKCVKGMSSVIPIRPKGHWIKGYTYPDGEYWKCDKCNELIKVKYPMHCCNNCGSDNREVEE